MHQSTYVGPDAQLRLRFRQRVDVFPCLVARGSSESSSLEVPLATLYVREDRQFLVVSANDALDIGPPLLAHRQFGLQRRKEPGQPAINIIVSLKLRTVKEAISFLSLRKCRRNMALMSRIVFKGCRSSNLACLMALLRSTKPLA